MEGALAKADLIKRVAAVVIDMIACALIALIPIIGGLIAVAYWLLRDGLDLPFMDRRSLGKKLVHLRPVRLDGGEVDVAVSVKRNWMFVLGAVLWPLIFVPVLGWILIVVLVVPVLLISLGMAVVEILLLITDDRGRRWGDRIANTMVVEVDA